MRRGNPTPACWEMVKMILYCYCKNSRLVDVSTKRELIRRLLHATVAFEAVPDLCELAVGSGADVPRDCRDGNLRIAACYPRTIDNLLRGAGSKIHRVEARLLNTRVQTPEAVVAVLAAEEVGTTGPSPGEPVAFPGLVLSIMDRLSDDDLAGLTELLAGLLDAGLRVKVLHGRVEPHDVSSLWPPVVAWSADGMLRGAGGVWDARTSDGRRAVCREMRERCESVLGPMSAWPAWFPVIDQDRCTNCRQCLNFCLFDVYSLDESGRVRVARPANCKNECPACARVCPHAAIIFPKYPAAPINGEEVDESSPGQENVAGNLAGALQGNLAEALRRRNDRSRRFSRERDQERAVQERCDCLVQIQLSLGGAGPAAAGKDDKKAASPSAGQTPAAEERTDAC